MIAFIRTFFAVVFAILFLAMAPICLLLLGVVLQSRGPEDGSWLTIHLSGPVLEHYGPVTLRSVLDEHPPTLTEITENLEKAAVDKRIDGVIFRLDWFSAGQGKLDEIRAGIRAVQDAGKPVYAYGWQVRDAGIYLGSACDSLFLFPKGWVYFLGRGVSIEHVKGLMDKLDVHAQLHRIDKYKSAAELFTTESSSKETIENVSWLLEDLNLAYDRVLERNLGIAPEDLAGLRERGILRAGEAVEAGLVSEAIYWDELTERLQPGEEFRWVSSGDYAEVERASLGLTGKPKVAVVHAQGFVAAGGDDRYSGVTGLMMGTDRVVQDLERVREDDRVQAIILRCDTGGGATSGAQRIARAVALAREKKPVVISIADQAASGGYMMSFPANHVVCPANGITGSIGSITGKFNLRGFWEKLGFTYDDIGFAPNAFLLSELHDYTPEQWERISEVHWESYNEWIEDIARARDLDFDAVDAVAQGRVWTGRQAIEKNLVDELGGFDRALAAARRLADLKEDDKVTIVHYPEKPTILDVLRSGDFVAATTQDLVLRMRESFSGPSQPAPLLQHFIGFRLE